MSMVSFSKEQNRSAKKLGEKYACWRCGEEHDIIDTDNHMLQYIKRNGDMFVVGIDGKQVFR